MSPWQTFALRILFPAALGALIATLILLLFPEWVLHEERQPAGSTPVDQLTANTAEPLTVALPVAPSSYASAVKLAAPAVVNIYTRKTVKRRTNPLLTDPALKRFFGETEQPDDRMQSSLGSGVILSPDGHIITNFHVIEGADEIIVALYDGRDAEATLVGSDPESDLAVLKIDLPDGIGPAVIADRSANAVGDIVLAIGNPFGVGQTVTMGIISATGRNRLGLNTYEDYIQTDAAINPGNSGGALINARGELVGINTAIFTQSGGNEGIGFAIPAEIAHRTMRDIARYGTTIRGWLGIEVQEASPELLESLRLPGELTGLLVTGVFPEGPAEQAGLASGDIIVGLNGTDADNAVEAMNRIAGLRPGDTISVDFLRRGERLTTTAYAGLRDQPQGVSE
ncbi:MAG: 2-alkenal reductase [Thalassolituus sp.]|jgi:serine protease DegS|nr:trypsin-like peptidase domain-containing protein [Pseudomonadota bacterium]TNC84046.1 MAG: 2-alkenal reductase [Thalassolituus sp.]